MEVKTGYKQTEMGVIPEDWETPPLGALFSFKNGLNKGKEFFGYGTPIVNYMDVYGHTGIRASDLDGRVDVNRQELDSFGVRRGDVFFTRTSETVEEVGIASVLLEDSPDTVFSGFILRARPKNDALIDQFKKYCFSSSIFRKQIISKSTYTTRALTNGRVLSGVLLPIPPTKAEQEAIAEALSDADGLIESLEQLIAKKRNLKQGAMQELLTGKRRLPGFSGEWEVKRLGEIAELKNGYAFKSATYTMFGNFNVITIANVQDGYMDVAECNKIDVLPRDLQSHHRLGIGDVLISMTGNVGRVCRVTAPECVLNQRVGKLVPSNTDTPFLFLLLCQPRFLTAMMGKAKGGAQGNLSVSDITSFMFRLPPSKTEQNAITTILSDMDAELTALETKLAKARSLKQGMMQELFTGRIRLV
ncbi:MAG: restriction endonuclease subunit S [Pseudomonadota bacterium]